ncbi:GNAT family N-acetyltransferase [Eubacteriales bacterium OttesenSCG-928-N13]|nr:GNAT family N-acetyltransferase [Eubacteriales bacterium OttesenSCG-928-N13]
MLTTRRLDLRPWQPEDAEALYPLAKDPRIGPICGWMPHTSVDNSRQIIRDVLMADETYAVTFKGKSDPIGSIGLVIGAKSGLGLTPTEGEIGYWIGVPYWGQGLIPEAMRELMRHGFEDLGLDGIYCGYFDGNEQSHRVQQKCGMHYLRTLDEKVYPLINQSKVQHVMYISKAEWETLARNTQ